MKCVNIYIIYRYIYRYIYIYISVDPQHGMIHIIIIMQQNHTCMLAHTHTHNTTYCSVIIFIRHTIGANIKHIITKAVSMLDMVYRYPTTIYSHKYEAIRVRSPVQRRTQANHIMKKTHQLANPRANQQCLDASI